MTNSEFVALLLARAVTLGSRISDVQARQFERYYGLLAKWNPRINLTALTLGAVPPPETLDRLFIEPLIASEMISEARFSVLDLGSGAGSPAIPLKILRPSMDLTMVETRSRKAAFLREVVRTLELREVDVRDTRFQDVVLQLPGIFDIVTVRGLRVDAEVLQAVELALEPEGRFMPFGTGEAPSGFVAVERRLLPDGSFVVSSVRAPRI
jgi:16S rRNA (guanine527-N7)-methyltransferase